MNLRPMFVPLLLLLLGFTLPCQAEVRVLLFQTQTLHRLHLSSPGGLRVVDEQTGSTLVQLAAQEPLELVLTSDLQLHVTHLKHAVSGPLRIEPGRQQARLWVKTPKTTACSFDGTLTVTGHASGLRVCNQVSEEAYLTSVVAHEMPTHWPAEALKVQAVLCRTYLAAQAQRHADQNADVCDLTHCQVFGGHSDDPAAANAVASTSGWVLTQNHLPVSALYHSTCGGRTTSPSDVWTSPQGRDGFSYAGVEDAGPGGDYCRDSPDYTWTLSLTSQALSRHLRRQGLTLPSTVKTISVDERDPSGRVKHLTLHFSQARRHTLSGDAFYRLWGQGGHWHQIKSTWFSVDQDSQGVHFHGHGLGHGVGLCQWGARGRALAGQRYDLILKHYFPHAELTHRPAPPDPNHD